MAQKLFLEELNQEIKADKAYSQILINIANSQKLFEEAQEIVESLGISIIEAKHLSTSWRLLKLDTKNMQDVALKLTEHGFMIKGINALP